MPQPSDSERILAAVRTQADRLSVDVQRALESGDAVHLFPWNDVLGQPDYPRRSTAPQP